MSSGKKKGSISTVLVLNSDNAGTKSGIVPPFLGSRLGSSLEPPDLNIVANAGRTGGGASATSSVARI
jgi:hypothetical protein